MGSTDVSKQKQMGGLKTSVVRTSCDTDLLGRGFDIYIYVSNFLYAFGINRISCILLHSLTHTHTLIM